MIKLQDGKVVKDRAFNTNSFLKSIFNEYIEKKNQQYLTASLSAMLFTDAINKAEYFN